MAKTSTTQPFGAGLQRMMLIPPVTEHDHTQGPATAAITLVEYGDYHNQQCATALPFIKSLQSRMGDRLRFIFRHFPSSSLHPNAAQAAEAAGMQDRFWEMHQVLFEHQSALGNGHLVEYARDLGMDTIQFLRDMGGGVPAGRVRSDLLSGAQSGVQDTPTFFVNGVCGLGSWKLGLASMTAVPAQNGRGIRWWADDTDFPALDSDEGQYAP